MSSFPGYARAGAVAALGEADISRAIEMAWEDRTAFEAIAAQFGLNESDVVALMRRHMKPSSFRMWRKRMAGRTTKHAVLRGAVFYATAPATCGLEGAAAVLECSHAFINIIHIV